MQPFCKLIDWNCRTNEDKQLITEFLIRKQTFWSYFYWIETIMTGRYIEEKKKRKKARTMCNIWVIPFSQRIFNRNKKFLSIKTSKNKNNGFHFVKTSSYHTTSRLIQLEFTARRHYLRKIFSSFTKQQLFKKYEN